MEAPKTGTFWKQHDFLVEIISHGDVRYKEWMKQSKYNKTGELLYIYHKPDDVKGKIGNYQQAENFLKTWTIAP